MQRVTLHQWTSDTLAQENEIHANAVGPEGGFWLTACLSGGTRGAMQTSLFSQRHTTTTITTTTNGHGMVTADADRMDTASDDHCGRRTDRHADTRTERMRTPHGRFVEEASTTQRCSHDWNIFCSSQYWLLQIMATSINHG